jgi:hypothetical protein
VQHGRRPAIIYYLATQGHTKPVTGWLRHYHSVWAFRFSVLLYEELGGWLEPGTFIFADYERLSPRLRQKALLTHRNATKIGCTVLNHPRKSLRRYALQKKLRNDFRVFRQHEIPGDLRYPVFLRVEDDHRGNLTPLLKTGEELAAALAQHPGSLIVEYLDTSDSRGVFRKYGAMRIGQDILPRHIMFGRHWMVKEDSSLITQAFISEEMDYLRENPHAGELLAIFELAKCDYGRIDYSILDGRIQVWEINSNPRIDPTASDPQRAVGRQEGAQQLNDAFRQLDSGSETQERRVWCGRPPQTGL